MKLFNFATLMIFFLLMAPASAGNTDVGVITALSAEVRIQRQGEMVVPHVGDRLYLNDTVETDRNGRVKILFESGVLTMISTDSQVQITRHMYDNKRNWRDIILDLRVGLMRVLIEKFTSDSQLLVQTNNAVAGVRGTDFLVRYSDAAQHSSIYVFEGEVKVMSRIAGEVILKAGYWTEIIGRKPPAMPLKITTVMAEELSKSTSIEDQVNSQGRKGFHAAAAGANLQKAPPAVGRQESPQVSILSRDSVIPARQAEEIETRRRGAIAGVKPAPAGPEQKGGAETFPYIVPGEPGRTRPGISPPLGK